MKLLILLSSLLFVPLTFAGDKGNGGSGSESILVGQQVQLESVALKLRSFFLKNEASLQPVFPEFRIQVLANKIKVSDIRVVDESKLIDKYGKSRTCLNFPDSSLIECNSSGIKELLDQPVALFVLVLHEYLGLIGAEETSPTNPTIIAGYSISKRIAAYVTRVNEYDLLLESFDDETAVCGLKGSIEERIKRCNKKKGNFALVTRTKEGYEVYKDLNSELIWGDRLSSPMMYSYAENACNTDLAEVGKLSGFIWRLPTINEFEEAEKNGMRKSLPNIGGLFRSSTVHSNGSPWAWLFSGDYGVTQYGYHHFNFSVRCVSR